MITKTDFLTYLQCPYAFWLAKFRPETASAPDHGARRRMRMGQEVDRLARDLFPGGTHVPYRPQPAEMITLTRQAINGGATAVFQGTFVAGDLLVKVDILQRDGSGWRLIEVKSSTSVKEEHIHDAAFQVYVLRQAGLPLTGAGVLFINKQCRYPDLSDLFTIGDVTADTQALMPAIVDAVADMRRLATLDTEPRPPIGRACKECNFHDHCWQGIEGLTIYHIPRLNAQKEEALAAAGVLLLEDVPDDFPLTETQRKFLRFHTRREVNIDSPAIRAALAGLRFPLYFFDFETIDHAVPTYDDTRPYQQVPFQYSCHILYADGSLVHREYLHTGSDDPRPALLQALLDDIEEDGGQVIAYNVPFERGVLNNLAGAYPTRADRLQEIVDRLWDQLPIFRKHYRHHGFGTSNSLKNVLPVLAPRLSYQALDVQDGSQAQVAWEKLIQTADGPEKEALAAQLRAYCKLDTLAMVEIHYVLREI